MPRRCVERIAREVIYMAEIMPVPTDVMELLRKVTASTVKDALAMSGIKSGITGIRPVRGFEDTKIVGPASTVLFSSPRPDGPKLNNYVVIEQSPVGSVLVIDGKGHDGHFAGDNQGMLAKRQGLVGMVVYGGARDLAGFREMGMPLYCTGQPPGTNPRTCS